MIINTTDIGFYKRDLFKRVQLEHLFEDQKTFADALPLMDTKIIEARYREEVQKPGFDLKAFIYEHFEIPRYQPRTIEVQIKKSIREHIIGLWDVLTRVNTVPRGSLLGLPYPYVAPGGRFDEMYYWDSYFTMLGLAVSNRIDFVEYMVENFTYLINTVGFIPNATRNYYLTRSQIPFYAAMIKLLQGLKGEEVLGKYLPALEKEYAFWMHGAEHLNPKDYHYKRVVRMEDGTILNRYWDDEDAPRPEGYAFDVKLDTHKEGFYRHIRAACESGWDFSSRWFEDEKDVRTICTTDIIPVDLNCMVLLLEKTLLEAYEYIADTEKADRLQNVVTMRIEAINKFMWDDELGVYRDFNFKKKKNTNAFTLAMLFPLFVRISKPDRAKRVLSFVSEKMLNTGGLQTTMVNSDQQWDASNGWAPLQWIGYKSALNYDDKKLAYAIKKSWMDTLEAGYERTGKLMEKYPVSGLPVVLDAGGEYLNQDGFGWTNGVYLGMAVADMENTVITHN